MRFHEDATMIGSRLGLWRWPLNIVQLFVLTVACALSVNANGQLITPNNVTTSGIYNNSDTLIYDGFFPVEWSDWTGVGNMWWNGQTGSSGVVAQFDLGAVYNVDDSEMSFDNNDTYAVDYSLDGTSWSNLFTVLSSYGEVAVGMDTFSTIATSPEYISQIDFATTQAQYLRVYAVGGDNAYSIGELQFFGTVVPEPTCLPLLMGLFAVTTSRRKR